jgi:phosphoserine aminotransferase
VFPTKPTTTVVPSLTSFVGIRASNYNAISESSVEKLVVYLKEFATA